MESCRDSSITAIHLSYIVGIQWELEVRHSNSMKPILDLTSPKSRCNHFWSQLCIVYNYDYYTPMAILCSSAHWAKSLQYYLNFMNNIPTSCGSWKVSLYASENPSKDTHEWLLKIETILLHVILTYDFSSAYIIIRRDENQSDLTHKLKMGNYLKCPKIK